MAAPRSRRLRNQAAPVVRTRREWTIAIGGSTLVVLATLFLIWAMRPGDTNSFTPGKGGIIHRQPKVALWLVATAIVIAFVSWLILRHDSKVRNQQRALLISISAVVVAAVVVMGVWHDSLVHDYAVPTVPTTPQTVPPLTTAPSASSTTPPTTSSTATSAGSVPPTTAAAPTTAATPTTVAAPSTTGG